MFGLAVQFKNHAQWGLSFKTEARAKAALNNIHAAISSSPAGAFQTVGNLQVEDDFGNIMVLVLPEVSGVLMEDFAKSSEAGVERAIINARMQAKAQSRAMSDPILKSSAMLHGDVHRMNGPMRG